MAMFCVELLDVIDAQPQHARLSQFCFNTIQNLADVSSQC